MQVRFQDDQIIAEVEGTAFETVVPPGTKNSIFFSNKGINTIEFRFQEHNGTTWVDIGLAGSEFYNSLVKCATKHVVVTPNYNRFRMVASASGGSYLDFVIERHLERMSGGLVG